MQTGTLDPGTQDSKKPKIPSCTPCNCFQKHHDTVWRRPATVQGHVSTYHLLIRNKNQKQNLANRLV